MPEEPLKRLEVTAEPYNAETPLEALLHPVTPIELVYVRNHFAVPELEAADWALRIEGAVANPHRLSLDEIQAHPSRQLEVAMECAGNARKTMEPRPPGTPWGLGAVSVVQFTGTSLANVLDRAGIVSDAVEALFVGADQGDVTPGRTETFARSLPLDVAFDPDTLLCWEMNGQPLPRNNGHPLRLVVPGWYGMASVKWLTRIEILTEPFKGFFQNEHYVYVDEPGAPQGEPVRRIRPRSLIVNPPTGASVNTGVVAIEGVAWSGYGDIAEVKVSMDAGATWAIAELQPPSSRYSVWRWSYVWSAEKDDTYTLLSQATDSQGNTQPDTDRWNRLGYGNNGRHSITVQIA